MADLEMDKVLTLSVGPFFVIRVLATKDHGMQGKSGIDTHREHVSGIGFFLQRCIAAEGEHGPDVQPPLQVCPRNSDLQVVEAVGVPSEPVLLEDLSGVDLAAEELRDPIAVDWAAGELSDPFASIEVELGCSTWDRPGSSRFRRDAGG